MEHNKEQNSNAPLSQQNYPPPNYPPQKRSKLGGCLLFVGAGFLLFVGFIFIGIILGIISAIGQSSSVLQAIKTQDGAIIEKIVTSGSSEKKIILIDIYGIIHRSSALTREHVSSQKVIQQLKKAAKDPDVVAIVLNMDTPGGGVTATDEIYHELGKIRKEKKILTCMHAIAASGGYYLAAGTDYIIANRLTLTGSIGVIIGGFNYHGLLQKIGLESEIYKSGKLKDILNMGRPRKEEEIVLIQELIDETYLEFAKIVSEGRQIDLEEIMSGPIGDAGIFSGKKALELGLVDQLGYLEDTLEKAKEMTGVDDPSIIRYAMHYSIFDRLFASVADSFREVFPGVSGIIRKGNLYYLSSFAL